MSRRGITRPGCSGRGGRGRGGRIDLPAVMSAAEAKPIAEAKLASLWTEPARRTVRGRPAPEPGRGTGGVDLIHGPTVAHLLDLPSLTDEPARTPRLFVAAAGPSAGWRRASLLVSLDDGARWEPIGATAPAATMGVVTAPPGVAGAALFDREGAVEVALLNDAMVLGDADEAGLIDGANLALVGDELIQFGQARPLGGNRWRLERLTRGRRGTEWAIAGHVAGERFILIEPETLLAYDPPLSAVGGRARVMAVGVGDIAEPVEALVEGIGEALRPPAPVKLAAARADGALHLRWTRRSRVGWRWSDHVDAPIGEESEAYRVTIARGDGVSATVDVAGPALVHPLDGYGGALSISVVQRGTSAVSRAATLILD